MNRWYCIILTLTCLTHQGMAADWPTYRGDASRSSVSTEKLSLPLKISWTWQSSLPPTPAWPGPARQNYHAKVFNLKSRNSDDQVFHSVIVKDALVFGSSSEDAVYCLNATTGKQRWVFFTEGPVRYAPVIAAGKVYAASDDGALYCLDLTTGKQRWRYTPAETPVRIANDKNLISLWPARTGPVVDKGVVYICFGIFPLQGTYQCAVDSETGKAKWMCKQPMPAQGYLVATPEHIAVPMGRTPPVLLSRKDGKPTSNPYGRQLSVGRKGTGGSQVVLDPENRLIFGPGDHSNGQFFQTGPKRSYNIFPGRQLVRYGDSYLIASGNRLARTKNLRTLWRKSKRKRKKTPGATPPKALDGIMWDVPCDDDYAMIVAGEYVVTGGKKKLTFFQLSDGKRIGQVDVQGDVYGLSAAQGRLYVSTTTGAISCLTSGPQKLSVHKPPQKPIPGLTSGMRSKAKTLIERAGIKQGYGLVFSHAKTPNLAASLALESKLNLTWVSSQSPDVLHTQRSQLAAAGLYGDRVVIHKGIPGKLPYSEYLINLVVWDRQDSGLTNLIEIKELFRVLRPYGGVAMIHVSPAQAAATVAALRKGSTEWNVETVMLGDETWISAKRGALPGAGTWTHMYGDGGNSAQGGEKRVGGDLQLQWFGRPGPRNIANRHNRNAATSLSLNGRLYVPGNQYLWGLDLYNGTIYWERPLPDLPRLRVNLTGSVFALTPDALYLSSGSRCLVINTADGKDKASFPLPDSLPKKKSDWGYTAIMDDVLLGSWQKSTAAYVKFENKGGAWSRVPLAQLMSDGVFAMNRHTGKLLWKRSKGAMPNTTMAVYQGALYAIESKATKALESADGRLITSKWSTQGTLSLVALNVKTGQPLWEKQPDLSALQKAAFLNVADGVVLVSGTFVENKRVCHLLSAFDSKTGATLWVVKRPTLFRAISGSHAELHRHPVIVGGVVYAEPWAYDLKTGKQREGWTFKRKKGCGPMTASANTLYGREYTLACYDLSKKGASQRITAVTRPGCGIGMFPVGGLLAVPESSSGCTCGYSIQTSMVFRPVKKAKK